MVKVVAKNFFPADKLEEVLKLYSELVEETRKEEGCIAYDLYQDEQDAGALTFIEEWKSRQALEEHMKSEHFTRLVPAAGKLASKNGEVNIYHKVF